MLFNSYDLDGDGYLNHTDIFNIFNTSNSIRDDGFSESQLKSLVDDLVKTIDTDKDGKVSYSDFYAAVKSKKFPLECIVHIPGQQ